MATEQWKVDNVDSMRKYRTDWYNRNKESEREKAKVRAKKKRQDRKEWFHSFKKTLKCNRCPEIDWRCLEFHHIDPIKKDRAISAIYVAWSIKRIMEEVAKCEVLCANCHKKHHREY